jgi:hypothetical protein
MSNDQHTTIYVHKKTRDAVNRLVSETGYPQYVVIGLAVEMFGEFWDDLDEMKKALQAFHENRGERGRPYKHAEPMDTASNKEGGGK